MGRIMIDSVFRHYHRPRLTQWPTSVRIDIEAREVGGRDVQPDLVPLQEQIAGRVECDRKLINFPRRQQFWLRPRVAVARTNDRISQVESIPVWIIRAGWIDIDQLGREVSIER